jgi:hypothetical protein
VKEWVISIKIIYLLQTALIIKNRLLIILKCVSIRSVIPILHPSNILMLGNASVMGGYFHPIGSEDSSSKTLNSGYRSYAN